jgi:hypothetical protein
VHEREEQLEPALPDGRVAGAEAVVVHVDPAEGCLDGFGEAVETPAGRADERAGDLVASQGDFDDA